MAVHPTRRNFIAGCGAALTVATIGYPGKSRTTPEPVSVLVRAGEVFPPLDLARKLVRLGNRTSARFSLIRRRDDSGSEIFHVALFPADRESSPVGPLDVNDIIAIESLIPELMNREFGCAVKSVEFVDAPGFWYPFTDHGAICCRLAVTAI